MIRREILPLAVRREDLDAGVCFEFEDTAPLHAKLEEFVAFERECCSGISWELGRGGPGRLRLEIRGLPPDSELLSPLADR